MFRQNAKKMLQQAASHFRSSIQGEHAKLCQQWKRKLITSVYLLICTAA